MTSAQPGRSPSAYPCSTAVADTLTGGDTDRPRPQAGGRLEASVWKGWGRLRRLPRVCPALLLAARLWSAEPGGVGRGPRRFQARGTLRRSAWDSGTRNSGGSPWRGRAQRGGERCRLEGNGHQERSPSAAWGRARRLSQRQTARAHYVTLSRGLRLPALVLRKTGR